ncbi:MAG: TonB family protein [Chiayiivirga sp.]|uniref:M56 family metallopeptidase n=1 Tax=Chiayiivirga sp. TaxID=2041042 RepID=UPI0025BD4E64|nr:M56 family metallopeptidase [Chiayiivirga sp.]MCI1711952.1 TonB family protein [Chiayiivirga sp.]MCI1729454.1 TonB family protein [Chiayiivirga sp.]
MATEWMQDLETLVSALGRTLVDTLWQGVLIAAAYALARVLLRTPRARLLAGHLALLALAIAPLITLATQLTSPQPALATAMVSGYLPQAVHVVVGAGIDSEPARWQHWLVAAWAAGVLVLSLRLWTQWRRLRRLCREAAPLDARWQARFESLKQRLGVRWRISLRAGVDIAAPMLVGVLRPTILLPSALLARMPVEQMELVLLHELAHLRRLDPLLNLVQTAIVTALFYHPAVHWIARKVNEDRELCCDEDVVAAGGDPLRYARVLLTLAEEEWPDAPAPALAASGGVLLQRVEHIVDAPRTRTANAQGVVLLALATVLVLVWWLPARERALPRWLAPAVVMVPEALLATPIRELLVANIAAPPTLRLQPVAVPTQADVEATPGASAMPHVAERIESPFAPLAIERHPMAPDLSPASPPRLPQTVVEAAVQPAPRYRVEPSYPIDARERGEQGWVELSYRIGRDGRVEEVALDRAEASVAFERAARDALRQWRFAPADADGRLLRVRFDFVLAGNGKASAGIDLSGGASSQAEAAGEAARCTPRTGTRLCSDLRDSVRQLSPR